jgi:hypothetical protein
MSICRFVAFALLAAPASAQGQVGLSERVGPAYTVRAAVDVTGTLTLPAEKGKAAPASLGVSGRSQIEYDERPLAPLADGSGRTIRKYRQADFRRVIGDKAQETTIRPDVRRMVVIRKGSREIPFSPDGPLTYGEVDVVRTDVFTPALAGLLPNRPVRVNDRWPAAATAVEELTDFERVEQGSLECRLTAFAGSTATIALSGTLRGVNEDGPVQQQLNGTITFDSVAGLITSLNLTGVKTLLDGQGRPTGRIEGKFTLTRQRAPGADITDAALRGLTLEPTPANSLLVYEGANVAFRFHYPRRWQVSAEQGRQVTVNDQRGNAILITLEPKEKVPTGGEYLREAAAEVVKQKGRVTRTDPPVRVRPFPMEVERFGMDIEVDSKPARMEYAVVRQMGGGATVAARLQPGDAGILAGEILEIAKSLRVGPAAPAGVVPLPGK